MGLEGDMNISMHKPASLTEKEIPRKEVLDVLVPFTASLSHSFVIALNSPWGTGKTTFINQFKQELEKDHKDCPAIYYNAWRADYNNDPFIDFCAEILSLEDNEAEASSEAKQNVLKYAKKIGSNLWNKKGNIALSLIAKIGSEEIANACGAGDHSESIADAVSGMVTQQIEQYSEQKSCTEDFALALEKFVSKVTDGKGPLIIFVDELDRCRPTYAVELLERVKHLFEIDNIVFVFSVDLNQLKHAVGTLYGHYSESEGYLKRFFDLVIDLPQIPLPLYIDILCKQYEMDNWKIYDILRPFIKGNNVTLRIVDKIFTILDILNDNKRLNKYGFLYSNNLIFFTCLKILEPKQFASLKEHELSPESFKDFLSGRYSSNASLAFSILDPYLRQKMAQTQYLSFIKKVSNAPYWKNIDNYVEDRPTFGFDWLLNRLDFTHELTR
ncbi:P-loop NTPase fold protein [Maridesulfovibrio sp.]|uniref:KAP family P-loop NTPase fold protein n=1 Tax=Maridesulfovibrio sp. TaxID=2795000 RepID=UPI0029C9C2D9|nr:P-loop NTPase fold protein [Maridesulfovibrio sp.]